MICIYIYHIYIYIYHNEWLKICVYIYNPLIKPIFSGGGSMVITYLLWVPSPGA